MRAGAGGADGHGHGACDRPSYLLPAAGFPFEFAADLASLITTPVMANRTVSEHYIPSHAPHWHWISFTVTDVSSHQECLGAATIVIRVRVIVAVDDLPLVDQFVLVLWAGYG